MPGIRRHESAVSQVETPYKDYLHSNFVPSEDECSRIRDHVAPNTQELEETTAAIFRLQASLDQMVRKRDQLEEYIDSHLALVSGARRLPYDILTEIFMACLPNAQYASMKSDDPPLLLCHICSAWRKLALSSPRLWASLEIREPSRTYPYPVHRICSEGVKSWLARSGSLPLSILSSSATNPMLKGLLDCAPRWEHIRLRQVSSAFVEALEQLSPEDTPLLQTAAIEVVPGMRTFALSCIGATNIRRLSLSGSCFGLQNLVSPLGLSHISLYKISSDQALDVLRQCPMLEACTLQTYDEGLPTDLRKSIQLARLQRFCFINEFGGTPVLFRHILLPNLRSLEYSGTDRLPDNFEALASVCTPETLTNLRISPKISTDQLGRVLRLFPMLQTICLHRPRDRLRIGLNECSLFALLTPTAAGSVDVLCPRLERICSLGLEVGSDEKLLTMIDARRSVVGCQPLLDVHIAFVRALQVDIIPRLPADGLGVDLRYPDAENKMLIRAKGYYRHWPRTLHTVAFHGHELGPPPDTLPVQIWRRDPDLDWKPISGEWLAEYEEWGLGAEEEEQELEPESEQDSGEESLEVDD
ncbi:hypothetical protein DFH06DRAFT_1477348 [Mycena polygramma]|nr:hypothetical protein DFH06DRAFT_1477348 [Mycena polygramma]